LTGVKTGFKPNQTDNIKTYTKTERTVKRCVLSTAVRYECMIW